MVRRRGTRGYGTLFSQFFILPFVALTFFILLWTLHMTAVRLWGPVVPGRITDRYSKYDKHDNKTRYYLVYRYELNGREYSELELMKHSVYLQHPVNSTVSVQVSPVWPGHDSVLRVPGRNIWENVWLSGGAALIMSAGMAAMAWYVFVLPAKWRRLALQGVPVRGRLTDKKIYGARPVNGYLYYEYQPDSALAPLTGSQSVRTTDIDTARVGDAYTILYDPQNPQSSIIYQYGDYEAV